LQQEREQVQQRTKVLADQAAQLQETEIRHLTEANKLKKELATVQNARAVLEADKSALEAEMAQHTDAVKKFEAKRAQFQEKMKAMMGD
jgi:flagellar basal body rod protein FlgB